MATRIFNSEIEFANEYGSDNLNNLTQEVLEGCQETEEWKSDKKEFASLQVYKSRINGELKTLIVEATAIKYTFAEMAETKFPIKGMNDKMTKKFREILYKHKDAGKLIYDFGIRRIMMSDEEMPDEALDRMIEYMRINGKIKNDEL